MKVYAAVSHGVLAGNAIERIDHSPLKRLFITDTVENQPVEFSEKIEVVSVAPLFGEAIKRIHNRESISAMFPKWASVCCRERLQHGKRMSKAVCS